jgi:hypothetical protein
MPNYISASLSTADKNTIKAHLDGVKAIITFLKNLQPKDRQKLFKMGIKSVGFVKLVISAMKMHPAAVPASFSVTEFEKDYALYLDLLDVKMQLQPLSEGIDDTLLLLGAELMRQARLGYKLIRTASKGDMALNKEAAEIGIRFKRSGRMKPSVLSLQPKQSITLQGIVPKRIFKTLNHSGVTLYRGQAALGEGKSVAGNSNFFIPTGWTTVTIVNNDAVALSIFSLIQK